MRNHFDREAMLAIIEEQKRAVLEHYAPYLLVLEAEVRSFGDEIVEQTPGPAPITKVVREELSDVVCARKGCGHLLTKKQVKTGGRYCSRRCNGLTNIGKARKAKVLTQNPDVVTKWRPSVTLEAGVGVTKGEV